jgi:hypothetical protein
MKRSRLLLEVLEERATPALYGIPWSDPRHLTLSFAPDGTLINGHASTLFQTLNAVLPTAVWQGEILKAVQTWAASANLSVGVVADGGQPFGAPGLKQGDPRFGDIRIGAQPMSRDALSVSVPHDPYLAGTWSGDVLLNSATDFTAPDANLYSIMLHEFGHVLGLADNDDPTSALYRSATDRPAALSPADVAALQALYGPGPIDPNHPGPVDNTFLTATPITYPGDPQPLSQPTPLADYGTLTAPGDTDMFALVTPSRVGRLTFLVQTAGISLLEPTLTVYDASGKVLGQAQSTNGLGDTVTVAVDRPSGNSTYYVKVTGATQDVSAVGRYGLAVTFGGEQEIGAAQIASVLRGPFDTLPAADLAQVFRSPQTWLHGSAPAHNTLVTALPLTTAPGHAADQHYEETDHLTSALPDYYQIQTPQNSSGLPVVLTATVNARSSGGSSAQVQLLDSLGNAVAANVLVNGGGTFTIQAANLLPGRTYYLEVSAAGEFESEGNSDNCSLVVDFEQPSALSRTFAAGTLTAAAPQQTYALYVAETQLFQFTLSAASSGARTGAAVDLTITDQAGNVVFDLVASAGRTASGGSVLLPPGPYTARFSMTTTHGHAQPLSYGLSGSGLTDPIGPARNDPTLAPVYSQPISTSVPPSNPIANAIYYYYPNGAVILDPFLWLSLAL